MLSALFCLISVHLWRFGSFSTDKVLRLGPDSLPQLHFDSTSSPSITGSFIIIFDNRNTSNNKISTDDHHSHKLSVSFTDQSNTLDCTLILDVDLTVHWSFVDHQKLLCDAVNSQTNENVAKNDAKLKARLLLNKYFINFRSNVEHCIKDFRVCEHPIELSTSCNNTGTNATYLPKQNEKQCFNEMHYDPRCCPVQFPVPGNFPPPAQTAGDDSFPQPPPFPPPGDDTLSRSALPDSKSTTANELPSVPVITNSINANQSVDDGPVASNSVEIPSKSASHAAIAANNSGSEVPAVEPKNSTFGSTSSAETVVAVNPCEPNPCLHNGVCHAADKNDTTIAASLYKCSCPPEWEGSINCSVRRQTVTIQVFTPPTGVHNVATNVTPNSTNEPPSSVALNCLSNHSTCVHGVCSQSGKCNCTGSGFEGPRCEKDVNECLSAVCSNRSTSTCENEVGSFKCICIHGFTGDLCDSQSHIAPFPGSKTSQIEEPSSNNIGAIIGGIVGGIAVIGLALGSYFLYKYVSRSRKLKGKYNPAKEEMNNIGGHPVPLATFNTGERLI